MLLILTLICPTPQPIKIQNIDWFSEEGQILMNKETGKFSRGSEGFILDIETNKIFKVSRIGGSKHADITWASCEDLNIFKEIVYEYSWTRRSVLFIFENNVIAGSINSMPHGRDNIENGISGHICLHLLNSKTHGGNRVDKDHQNAIQQAAKYLDFLN